VSGAAREAAAPVRTGRWTALLLLAALALMWGSNWPAMKLALAELPIPTFRTLCCAFGGIALLAIARAGGERLGVRREERWPVVVTAFFNITVWHVTTAIALTLIGAGRASIIAFTMPVWAALLAVVVLDEKLTPRKIAGLALGLAGLGALVLPDWARIAAAPLGVLSVLVAAVGWAAGTVLMKRYRWSISSAQLSGWQLLVGGLPIFLATPFLDDPIDALAALDPMDWLLLAYVLAVPMVLAQWIWVRLVRILPAGIAAIGSMAVPVVGVLSSAFVLGERVGLAELAALVLVVGAIALVLLPRRA
jgi:drug/metabolite transporter (DMT)-like permease